MACAWRYVRTEMGDGDDNTNDMDFVALACVLDPGSLYEKSEALGEMIPLVPARGTIARDHHEEASARLRGPGQSGDCRFFCRLVCFAGAQVGSVLGILLPAGTRRLGLILMIPGGFLVLCCAGILGTRGILETPGSLFFPREFVAFGAISLCAQSYVAGRSHSYGGTGILRVVSMYPAACCNTLSLSSPACRLRGRTRPRKAVWKKLWGLQTLGQSMVAKLQRQRVLTARCLPPLGSESTQIS